jgi:site-specific recombinase XerD
MMLEELERRNYSQSTVRTYVKTIADLARYFKRPPDQLGPDQLRQYQVYLFRERKLAANTVNQPESGISSIRQFLLHKSGEKCVQTPKKGVWIAEFPQRRSTLKPTRSV